MKVGIIGGNGFIGRGIRSAFHKNGIQCESIQRENYDSFRGVSFDILINANGNSKKYFAAQSPKEEFEASVISVQKSLIDLTYELYIHCSSVDVYSDHEHPNLNTEETPIDSRKLSMYGFHKLLAEQIVQRYAKRWLVLRFGGFVGEGLKKNSIYDILNNVPLRVHSDSSYQFLSTVAAGTIVIQLIDSGVAQQIVNVCGDGCISLKEVADHVPEYRISYAVEIPPREKYEISINKLRAYCYIPTTRDSVLQFVQQYKIISQPIT